MSEGTQLPEFLKLTCSKLFVLRLKQYAHKNIKILKFNFFIAPRPLKGCWQY